MTLLTAVPGSQRLLTGQSLSLSVRAAADVVVSWWRNGVKIADGDTLPFNDVQTKDAGLYVVQAVKDTHQEIHAVQVEIVSADSSVSVDLSRKSHGWWLIAALVLAVVVAAALARAPVARAVSLSQVDDGRPDAALIALVATAASVVLLLAGVFVGVMTVLTRAQSDTPDKVETRGVDPATVAKVVASLDRPRFAAALLAAGLLLLAVAAALAWRLAGAPPPTEETAAALATPVSAEVRLTG